MSVIWTGDPDQALTAVIDDRYVAKVWADRWDGFSWSLNVDGDLVARGSTDTVLDAQEQALTALDDYKEGALQ